jgi:hypothetical protein
MPSIRHLTPDRIPDIAYSLYLLTRWQEMHEANPRLKMPPDIKMGERGVAEFNRLAQAFPENSPEQIYLTTMYSIIVSLAREIARSKKAWLEKKQSAEEECARRIMETSKASLESSMIVLIKRYLLIGGVGFALAKAVIPWLEMDMASKSQPNYLSVAFAGGLVLASGYLKSKLDQYQASNIYTLHNYLIWYANKEYSLSVKLECRRAENAARRAWRHMTGKEAPRFRGYDEFLAEILELESEFRRHCLKLTASPLKSIVVLFVEKIKKTRTKTRGRK